MAKIKSLFISIDPLENRRRLLMHLDAARSLNWNIFVFTSSGENNSKQESDENIVIKEINLRFKNFYNSTLPSFSTFCTTTMT